VGVEVGVEAVEEAVVVEEAGGLAVAGGRAVGGRTVATAATAVVGVVEVGVGVMRRLLGKRSKTPQAIVLPALPPET
jgi:hypothetical protein